MLQLEALPLAVTLPSTCQYLALADFQSTPQECRHQPAHRGGLTGRQDRRRRAPQQEQQLEQLLQQEQQHL